MRRFLRVTSWFELVIFALAWLPSQCCAFREQPSSALPAQRITTALPMRVEVWRDADGNGYQVFFAKDGTLDVPQCGQRFFYLEYCNDQTVDAYAAECRRLSLDSVTLPPAATSKTIVSLLHQCPGITGLRLDAEMDVVGGLFNSDGVFKFDGVDDADKKSEVKSWRMGDYRFDDDDEPDSSVFSQLRTLVVLDSRGLATLRGLANAKNLETLQLALCFDLTDIAAVAQFKNLRCLALKGCGGISDLSALRELKNLENLQLYGIPSARVAEPVFGLATLRALVLSVDEGAVELPSPLPLKDLRQLDLGACDDVRNTARLAELPKLQYLAIPGREDVVSALPPMDTLLELRCVGPRAPGDRRVVDMSFAARHRNLQFLAVENCEQVKDVSGLTLLCCLRRLELGHCVNVADFSPISKLHDLEQLDLSDNRQIQDVSFVIGLEHLARLRCVECPQLCDLSGVARCQRLKCLDILACERASDLSPVASLGSLLALNAAACREERPLSRLPKARQATAIQLGFTTDADTPLSLGNTSALRRAYRREDATLAIWLSKDINRLSLLTSMHELQSLDIFGYRGSFDVSTLPNPSGLRTLVIRNCDGLKDLSSLSMLTGLQSLTITECKNLVDISGLARLPGLRRFELTGVHQVSDLSALAHLKDLVSLALATHGNASDLSVLSTLGRLRWLRVSNADRLRSLAVLAGLKHLELLEASNCGGDILALRALSQLRFLRLLDAGHVSESDFAALRKSLPDCAIDIR